MSRSSIAPDKARRLAIRLTYLRQKIAKPLPALVPLEAPFWPHLDCNQAVEAGLRPLWVRHTDSQRDASPRKLTIQVDTSLEFAAGEVAEGEPVMMIINDANSAFPYRKGLREANEAARVWGAHHVRGREGTRERHSGPAVSLIVGGKKAWPQLPERADSGSGAGGPD